MKKSILLCLLSAAFLIFSFPRSNCWLLAWVGFVPLFFALEGKTKRQAFLLAFFTGVVFWAGIVYWLGNVTVIGTIVLILYLALYVGFFGLFLSTVYSLRSTVFIIFLPTIWVILEYLRSHLLTGFPWALLGYSQCNNLSIIQIADITGAYGVSFFIVMVNMAIYSAFSLQLSAFSKIKKIIPCIICLICVLCYGFYKLSGLQSTVCGLRSMVKISVVQPNIAQELKWDARAIDLILSKYSRITESAALDNPDLIVWPEAASPGLLGEDGEIFEEISLLSEKIKIPLLIGAVARDAEDYFNTALLINSQGYIVQRYNKLHLVPFGEYIPLKKYFPFLQTIAPIGDITRGNEYTVFSLRSTVYGLRSNFAVLICFEDVFPEISREFVKRGAGFLVNITNDAWYKYTSAAYQHFQASVFRAVENRVYIARSANTGVSGFIAPSGKIISLVKDKENENIFVDGFAAQEFSVPDKKDLSFYTKHGDVFVIACFLFALCAIIALLKNKK
ncbi:MAG: apolipoprotein N-acyltransferase [Candidatus Omnitrophota bacterium]